MWAVIGVVLIAVGALGLISWLGSLDRETRTETFDGVGEFVFALENSPLDIVTGGDQLVVDMSVSTGFWGGTVSLEQDGETVTLRQDCPFIVGWGCSGTFEVTVPPGVEISGETANGAITAIGTDSSLSVGTSNGAITLDDISSPVDVSTSNGSIVGTDLGTTELAARTSNGEVSLAFSTAPSSVVVETSNGEVEVVLPADTPAVALSTKTSNGEVTSDIRTDPAAADRIDVRTSNGDIEVRYSG